MPRLPNRYPLFTTVNEACPTRPSCIKSACQGRGLGWASCPNTQPDQINVVHIINKLSRYGILFSPGPEFIAIFPDI